MDAFAEKMMTSFSKSLDQTTSACADQDLASDSPTIDQPSTSSLSGSSSMLKTAVIWTEEMNVLLCREVDFINPFQYKQRTKESSRAWDDITTNLQRHGLPVTKRAVRDKYYKLKESVLKRNRCEEKASGVAPELTGTEAELTQIIEDLTEVENDSKEMQTKQQQKEEKKQQDGVEMRKRALETFTETNKRIKSEKEPRKRRNTGSDASDFLLRKLEMDREMKDKEMQLRKEEVEARKVEERRKREIEEREEERRRRDEERRREKEEREEERRRKEDADRERRMDLFQQQLLQQNKMILMMLKNQKKD